MAHRCMFFYFSLNGGKEDRLKLIKVGEYGEVIGNIQQALTFDKYDLKDGHS